MRTQLLLSRLTPPGFFITLNAKVIESAQQRDWGPDADLLIRFVDLLYHRDETYDDEPLTDEDWSAIREGKEAIRRGEFISLEELEKELGL